MSKYFMEFNTGAGNEIVEGTLDQAIEFAISNVSYTGENVNIYEEQQKVAQLNWYFGEATEDDEAVATIGDTGFYTLSIF